MAFRLVAALCHIPTHTITATRIITAGYYPGFYGYGGSGYYGRGYYRYYGYGGYGYYGRGYGGYGWPWIWLSWWATGIAVVTVVLGVITPVTVDGA